MIIVVDVDAIEVAACGMERAVVVWVFISKQVNFFGIRVKVANIQFTSRISADGEGIPTILGLVIETVVNDSVA
jgi:hypothetical protein